jgi:hypothetical protein
MLALAWAIDRLTWTFRELDMDIFIFILEEKMNF